MMVLPKLQKIIGQKREHHLSIGAVWAVAFGIALLLTGCSLLPSGTVPRSVLDSCVATRTASGDLPIDKMLLRPIVERLVERGGVVKWEATQGSSGIIRITADDQLTHRTSQLALEMAVEPTDVPGCNGRLATVTRAEADNNVLDAYETDALMHTTVRAVENAAPAAAPVAPASAPVTATRPTTPASSPTAGFPAADRIASTKPQLGNCHTGGCSWSEDQSLTTIRADARGRLVRLTKIGGTSLDDRSAIKWDDAPHEIFVFCSLNLPAVMIQNGSSWQVDVLDFINGPPDIEISSATTYAAVCHGHDTLTTDAARSLGYRTIPEELEDVSISSPTQIFDKVPK